MYKFKNKQTIKIFNHIIKRPVHHYPTRFSKDNFSVKNFVLRTQNVQFLSEGQKFGTIMGISQTVFEKYQIFVT